jgi:hypothetical protein
MDSLLLAAAVLACPVGMGLMMWMMMRGNNNADSTSTGDKQREVAHCAPRSKRSRPNARAITP